MKLSQERRDRREAIEREQEKMSKSLGTGLHVLKAIDNLGTGPMSIIGPRFDLQLGKLSLQEETLDKEIQHSLQLAEGQDAAMLKAVPWRVTCDW